ncbi:uncharacterized protein EV420DRAFT_1201028 [Desarmillaria tabescens]|uniref:Secreted protein n=1 Tax=Armillaria tabescens TaxID=1929756 RepID=A0AA39NBL6_ARMTA|nr:uncharacterized protein EV420DRAFT_1201028 [Desarmillaria tabescens]KAK0462637.1 hypothetical protein EV420DRAFT_1201028 [Desarmillaria tabescens]
MLFNTLAILATVLMTVTVRPPSLSLVHPSQLKPRPLDRHPHPPGHSANSNPPASRVSKLEAKPGRLTISSKQAVYHTPPYRPFIIISRIIRYRASVLLSLIVLNSHRFQVRHVTCRESNSVSAV